MVFMVESVAGLDNIVLPFLDVAEAKRFFVDGLGLSVISELEDSVFLRLGTQTLVLIPSADSVPHVIVLGVLVNDFTSIIHQLNQLGFVTHSQTLIYGPEGLKVHLVPGPKAVKKRV